VLGWHTIHAVRHVVEIHIVVALPRHVLEVPLDVAGPGVKRRLHGLLDKFESA